MSTTKLKSVDVVVVGSGVVGSIMSMELASAGMSDPRLLSGKISEVLLATASGLVAGSDHAVHIHLGSCESQGAVKYSLNDLVASLTGAAETNDGAPCGLKTVSCVPVGRTLHV